MNLYRLEYTVTENSMTEDVVLWLTANDDEAAVTSANSRIPADATNKKLYLIGTEVSLE